MSNLSLPAATRRATRREWIGLAVLALPCVLYSMDLTVLNLAIPDITADLLPSAAEMLWIVDIYGFLVAGFLVTMGTLGDRIGRRRLLLIGATAFGLASVLAAFSTSAAMLIVARALLGIAGATLAPSTLSLIRGMFADPGQRTIAIGIWLACFSAGAALGPLVGGVLLAFFPWGSVFLIAVPVMLLLLLIGPFLLPEFRDPDPGRLDLPSAGLSILAVLAIIFGIKEIAAEGALSATTLVAIGLGVLLGFLFIRRQRRLEHPLVDLRLFRLPAVGFSLTINILALFVAFGAFLFIAQYLQLVAGLSPLAAGLWSLPTGLALAAGAIAAPMLVRVMRPSTAISVGFIVAAIGLAVMTQAALVDGPLILVIGATLMSLGFAPIGALTTDFVLGSAPPERAGAVSAVSETSFEFGGALGIAMLGSLVTALYRGSMNATGTSAVEGAGETLGNAVVAAAEIGGEAGAALLAAARDAFTSAVALTSWLCAVIAIGAAALAAVRLRRVTSGAASG